MTAAARTATAPRRAASSRPPRPSVERQPAQRRRASTQRATRAPRRTRPLAIAAGIVVACLLAAVGGNMILASGQLQLEQLQAKVVAAGYDYAAESVTVAHLESPAHVASSAQAQGDVVPQVLQIPTVSLTTRLPAPTFSSLPCCSLTPGR